VIENRQDKYGRSPCLSVQNISSIMFIVFIFQIPKYKKANIPIDKSTHFVSHVHSKIIVEPTTPDLRGNLTNVGTFWILDTSLILLLKSQNIINYLEFR